MKKTLVQIASILTALLFGNHLFGQSASQTPTQSNQKFKLSIENSFYASDDEILSRIMTAVIEGKINTYDSYDLSKPVNANSFLALVGTAWNLEGAGWPTYADKVQGTFNISSYLTAQNGQQRLDKTYEIKSISLVLPKEYAKNGIEKEIGFFCFEEVNKLFANEPYALELSEKVLKNGSVDFQKLQLTPTHNPVAEAMAASH